MKVNSKPLTLLLWKNQRKQFWFPINLK